MKKRSMTGIKALVMLVCAAIMVLCLHTVAGAADYEWNSETGTLTIRGTSVITHAEVESACGNSLGSITCVDIKEGVTGIGYSAFFDCANLKSITIPSSVTSIGERAFDNCYSLGSILIPSG